MVQLVTETNMGKPGLIVQRRFTLPGKSPYDMLDYEKRTSVIKEPDGSIVFELKDIEVPKSWTQLATDIVASKYFRKAGVPGTGNEVSVKQVVYRIAHTIRSFGEDQGYFSSKDDANSFEDELAYMLLTQRGAFNSPVWFNCGLFHQYGILGSAGNFGWSFRSSQIETLPNAYERPQCSACFIQSVHDDIRSIFNLLNQEAIVFKYGSGTGSNFSKLRAAGEKLSGGGTSSGVMSFLKIFDTGAGSIKSGGTTRRAAKMVVMDIDHPDILTFIEWKAKEEQKAKLLIEHGGFPADFNGEAYATVSGQNSNNSVRITDEFMNAYLSGGKWATTWRTTGKVAKEYDAKFMMRKIAEAAWACADPGVQYDSTVNDWHTASNTDRINASNPCSEYMFLDDTACNLASINLMKFTSDDNAFDIEGYRHACRTFFIAQEILVDLSSYPTKPIAQNSHDYRTLGLGYANLGTMLMVSGIPYDSEKGRAIAGALTAIMTGHAYKTSAEMSAVKGPFPGYAKNKEPCLRVMNKHRDAAYKIDVRFCPSDLLRAAREDWDDAVAVGEKHGYRNAQSTVIAPTGTIGLLMDCDTTGVEPEFAIVKWKKLAGGGYFKIVNHSILRALNSLGYSEDAMGEILEYVLGHNSFEGAPHVSPEALRRLGFTAEQVREAEESVQKAKTWTDWTPHINPKTLINKGLSKEQISDAKIYIEGAQTLEGAPGLKEEHTAVFDCANVCGIGKRFIAPMGHIKMMAAVQPFISGAISKTVNMPSQTTVEEIEMTYVEGWKLGLKAIALYRDGCKASQPLNTKSDEKKAEAITAPIVQEYKGLKRGEKLALSTKRKGVTIEATVSGHKVFLRTGEYDDGKVGEIFIDMHKEGAAYRSLVNCFAIAVSIGLQYGVPLEKFVEKFTFTRFEPNGMTDHPNIRMCTSIIDLVFRIMGYEYLGRTDFLHVKPTTMDEVKVSEGPGPVASQVDVQAPLTNFESRVSDDVMGMQQQMGKMMGDAPACSSCGHVTVRNGSCYKCLNCGNSMGCS
jgi:ribonucleoside-diphosphate reductase alpha chain